MYRVELSTVGRAEASDLVWSAKVEEFRGSARCGFKLNHLQVAWTQSVRTQNVVFLSFRSPLVKLSHNTPLARRARHNSRERLQAAAAERRFLHVRGVDEGGHDTHAARGGGGRRVDQTVNRGSLLRLVSLEVTPLRLQPRTCFDLEYKPRRVGSLRRIRALATAVSLTPGFDGSPPSAI